LKDRSTKPRTSDQGRGVFESSSDPDWVAGFEATARSKITVKADVCETEEGGGVECYWSIRIRRVQTAFRCSLPASLPGSKSLSKFINIHGPEAIVRCLRRGSSGCLPDEEDVLNESMDENVVAERGYWSRVCRWWTFEEESCKSIVEGGLGME
jgi:hypothetical protein